MNDSILAAAVAGLVALGTAAGTPQETKIDTVSDMAPVYQEVAPEVKVEVVSDAGSNFQVAGVQRVQRRKKPVRRKPCRWG